MQSGSSPRRVRFTTAVYGVHRPGTAYRLDEVPIPLRVLLPTDYPSDGEVLGEIDRSRQDLIAHIDGAEPME